MKDILGDKVEKVVLGQRIDDVAEVRRARRARAGRAGDAGGGGAL